MANMKRLGRKLLRTMVCAISLLFAAVVFAHHSNTPFDMSQMLQASGVIEKVSFKNPHSVMTLVIDIDGKATAVIFEGHSLATLRHYGLLPSMVKKGDNISISYAPRRDGKPGGIFLIIETKTGDTLDFSNLGYD